MQVFSRNLNQLLFKIAFVAILSVYWFTESIEIIFLFGVILLIPFLLKPIKISIPGGYVLLVLSAILIIGFSISVFYGYHLIDFIRDLIYFSRPIIYFVLGYILIKNISEKTFLIKAIVLVSIIFSVIHIWEVSIFLLNNEFEIDKIRYAFGKSNYLEMFTSALLVNQGFLKNLNIRLRYRKFILIVLFTSLLLYFSRTILIGFLLFVLALNGYLRFSKKGFTYLGILILLFLIIYSLLVRLDIKRDAIGFKGFLYKLKMAPSEIFVPSEKIDIQHHGYLWDHWRAYEVSKFTDQIRLSNHPVTDLIIGRGFGAKVDLGFEAPLGSEPIQYIPLLHNGYFYILLKTGFIGLMIYVCGLLYLYLFTYFKTNVAKMIYLNNLIAGFSLYYLFTTLIITGIYNSGDYLIFILGGVLSLHNFYKSQSIENCDNRNKRYSQ